MIYAIIQAVAIFFVPWLIIKNHKFFITKWIGTVGTAYLLGIIVSLVIFGLKKIGLNFTIDTDIGEISSHLAISIAIPLLLFSSNLSEAKKLSKTVLKSIWEIKSFSRSNNVSSNCPMATIIIVNTMVISIKPIVIGSFKNLTLI